MLIDDDPVQLRIREAILREARFEVYIATTGDSALALMRTEEPLASGIGVVITDHLMPGLSGAALSRELRKINNDVPIIVLSGLPDAGTEYDALNVAFLQKPFPPHELIQLVHKIAVARAA